MLWQVSVMIPEGSDGALPGSQCSHEWTVMQQHISDACYAYRVGDET